MSDSLWPHGCYSLSGSSVHGIFQARILEWVAFPISSPSGLRQFPANIQYILKKKKNQEASIISFFLPFFLSFNKILRGNFSVPGTGLGAGDTVVSDKIVCFLGIYSI